MAKPYCTELDFYLQAYRLHQRMTKSANDQTQQLLQGLTFPRAHGLLAFTILNAKLNGWVPLSAAQAAFAQVKNEIIKPVNPSVMTQTPLVDVVNQIGSLDVNDSLDDMLNGVMRFRSAMGAALDGQDFDNWWSYATVQLYTGDPDGAYDNYEQAHSKAHDQHAPHITRDSLKVDRADRKFFTADYAGENDQVPKGVVDAIAMIKEAIADAKTYASEDTKWRRWNWSLGWAYYEAYDYAHSLAALLQIQKPHDLIMKNIIASYAGLGELDVAIPLAADFLSRNPDYSLDLENGWPYADANRRMRWKQHLSDAGLPGDVN